MKALIIVLLSIVGLSNPLFAQNGVNDIPPKSVVYDVSLVQLIANPEKYHGKRVQVVGYLNLEFEGNAIYLHQEDFTNNLVKNAFWVDFSERVKQEKKLTDYNKKYVIIIGLFDMNLKGHMSLFSGELKDITRLDSWQSRK